MGEGKFTYKCMYKCMYKWFAKSGLLHLSGVWCGSAEPYLVSQGDLPA
jgi:hypothetical protein